MNDQTLQELRDLINELGDDPGSDEQTEKLISLITEALACGHSRESLLASFGIRILGPQKDWSTEQLVALRNVEACVEVVEKAESEGKSICLEGIRNALRVALSAGISSAYLAAEFGLSINFVDSESESPATRRFIIIFTDQ